MSDFEGWEAEVALKLIRGLYWQLLFLHLYLSYLYWSALSIDR